MYAIDYLSSKVNSPTPPTLVEITPADARRMLENSVSFQNRRVKKSAVKEYAASIKGGNWNHMIGDPIRLDTHGRVIDGQHRLLAVVEAETPQFFYVISNLPPEAANFVDIGRVRSHSDFIGMAGVNYYKDTAAAIRWVTRYDTQAVEDNNPVLPKWAVVDYLNQNPGILRSVDIGRTVRDLTRRTGVTAGCHYIFSRIDEAQADVFFDKLRTGLGLTETDPVYVLRERLIDPWRKIGETELGAFIIKAWNHTRAGTRVQRMIWVREKEDFPIAF